MENGEWNPTDKTNDDDRYLYVSPTPLVPRLLSHVGTDAAEGSRSPKAWRTGEDVTVSIGYMPGRTFLAEVRPSARWDVQSQ